MIQKFLVLTISALFFATACQTQNSTSNVNQSSNTVAKNSIVSTTANAANTPVNSENRAAQTISFDAPDGVKIVGTLYAAAAANENAPAVLMLHQFGSNRGSYKDLARQFQTNGIAVLAIDGRGFGESTKRADGSRIAASQSSEAVTGMKSDVAAAVKFLSEQPNIDENRIGIVGASYGSSLAIIHADGDANIKAVALLSPGLNYFGNLPTEPALKNYGARPVLLVAAEDDADSAAAVRRLHSIAAGERRKAQIYERGGHGTAILSADVNLDKLLIDFFKANL